MAREFEMRLLDAPAPLPPAATVAVAGGRSICNVCIPTLVANERFASSLAASTPCRLVCQASAGSTGVLLPQSSAHR